MSKVPEFGGRTAIFAGYIQSHTPNAFPGTHLRQHVYWNCRDLKTRRHCGTLGGSGSSLDGDLYVGQ